jgi:hypothetical protein
MPVNLAGEVTQEYWFPLIIVLFAGLINFLINLTIEGLKHRKELKRQVYFELIDVITKTRKVYEDNILYKQLPDVEKKDKDIEIVFAFQAAKFKAYVGGSKEVNAFIDTQYKKVIEQDNKTYQKFFKGLIDLMTQELVKPWWQFWKRR